jgi:hypothetical protein
MDKLYPIVRRIRRPLLPTDEMPPPAVVPEKEKPIEGETPISPKETPDDAGADN